MGFSRTHSLPPPPTADQLTADMIGIGMLFSGQGSAEPDIELTLLFASEDGMERPSFRTLAVLCTWLHAHLRYVNVDRLYRLVALHHSARVRTFWAAVAHWQKGDGRLRRFRGLHHGRQLELDEGSGFLLRRHGEDARFAGSPLLVHAKLLRDRAADIESPAEVAAHHGVYRLRVLMGATYRADVLAALARDAHASTAELARRAGCSFGAARLARIDAEVVGARLRSLLPPLVSGAR